MHELDADFEIVRRIAREAEWPGVEEGLSYGTPGLKVRGKFLTRIREPDVVVLLCEIEEKEFLMEAMPDVYFQTPHYQNYPAVLARLSKIDPEELRYRLERTWARLATKKMIAEYESRGPQP